MRGKRAPSIGRGERTARLVLAMRALSRSWLGTRELGAEIGAHERTAYRLINGFVEAGLPVQRRRDAELRVRYHLPQGWWEQRRAGGIEMYAD